MYSRVVPHLLPALAMTLAAAVASARTDIDANARLSATVPPYGQGFCAQFTKGSGAHEVGSTAAALRLLDGSGGPPYRSNPDYTFFDIVPVADLHDGADGTTGRQLGYNAFFPWSAPASVWTTESCQSHGGGTVGANRFAMRLRADLIVPSAGTYTLAMRSDDGYRVSVAGVTVMETSALRSTAVDTRRVRFAEAGTYAIEVVYFENDVHAVFELLIASSDVRFVSDADNAAVATSGGVDLTNRAYSTLPAQFVVMSSAHVTLPTWLAAGDDDCSAYVDQPSTTCTMPSSAVAVTCGNGRVDAFSDGGAEACDDGNKVDGDGCSSTCALEAGWVCARHPSICGTDIDGDGIADSDDADDNDGPNGDLDGDGIPNSLDTDNTDGPLGDIDGDGIPNHEDADNTDGPNGDVDGDGIPNHEDADNTDGPNGDVDGDGIPNHEDADNTDGPNGDIDGDGIPNHEDADNTDGPNGDVDGDGIPNHEDADSTDGPNGDIDGDGIPNHADADSTDGPLGDRDGDGIPSGLDATPNGESSGSGNGGGSSGTGNGGGTAGPGNGEGEPSAQSPDANGDALPDELTDDTRFGLAGAGGCAATSPSGLTPFAVLAMGLFVVRRRPSR